jgi:hypothetical protein
VRVLPWRGTILACLIVLINLVCSFFPDWPILVTLVVEGFAGPGSKRRGMLRLLSLYLGQSCRVGPIVLLFHIVGIEGRGWCAALCGSAPSVMFCVISRLGSSLRLPA